MDKRHLRRVHAMQNLYAASFSNKKTKSPFSDEDLSQNILQHVSEIDVFVSKYATKYPLDKIARVDLAILRIAIYELILEKKQPSKVVIDEAIELAKEFGSDRSYSFVNGVLAGVIKDQKLKT